MQKADILTFLKKQQYGFLLFRRHDERLNLLQRFMQTPAILNMADCMDISFGEFIHYLQKNNHFPELLFNSNAPKQYGDKLFRQFDDYEAVVHAMEELTKHNQLIGNNMDLICKHSNHACGVAALTALLKHHQLFEHGAHEFIQAHSAKSHSMYMTLKALHGANQHLLTKSNFKLLAQHEDKLEQLENIILVCSHHIIINQPLLDAICNFADNNGFLAQAISMLAASNILNEKNIWEVVSTDFNTQRLTKAMLQLLQAQKLNEDTLKAILIHPEQAETIAAALIMQAERGPLTRDDAFFIAAQPEYCGYGLADMIHILYRHGLNTPEYRNKIGRYAHIFNDASVHYHTGTLSPFTPNGKTMIDSLIAICESHQGNINKCREEIRAYYHQEMNKPYGKPVQVWQQPASNLVSHPATHGLR